MLTPPPPELDHVADRLGFDDTLVASRQGGSKLLHRARSSDTKHALRLAITYRVIVLFDVRGVAPERMRYGANPDDFEPFLEGAIKVGARQRYLGHPPMEYTVPFLTVTHVASGLNVQPEHPKAPVDRHRPVLFPASAEGLALAERWRKELLYLAIDWDVPDVRERTPTAWATIKATRPRGMDSKLVKLERDIAKELKAALEPHWEKGKAWKARGIGDLVRSRVFWYRARGRKAAT